ncbi:hypothetical protein [Sphingosinithalassobacter portus]|uniref:hypothetical protein n=1 Tax=Stakelama portus TaxID=2676234 RepID=UPI000D6EA8E1|nr:hypothetical protein [Sphingosinithalassobacter portus]
MTDKRDDDLIAGRASAPTPPNAEQEARDHAIQVRKRQKSRALVMALMLGAFVLLIFAISIVKIAAGVAP